ncbi:MULTISPECIES: hypothetical protein [unclassified Kitasatospora]|uniref:hypothetical protein n=1 Tax=unclassified Kitasatospora TaxID=2633591 RepID=UPI0038184B81
MLDPLAADVSDLAPKGSVDAVKPPGRLGVMPSEFARLVDAERQRSWQVEAGDVQFPEDGLDPEAVLVLVGEPQYRRWVGSSSWP